MGRWGSAALGFGSKVAPDAQTLVSNQPQVHKAALGRLPALGECAAAAGSVGLGRAGSEASGAVQQGRPRRRPLRHLHRCCAVRLAVPLYCLIQLLGGLVCECWLLKGQLAVLVLPSASRKRLSLVVSA